MQRLRRTKFGGGGAQAPSALFMSLPLQRTEREAKAGNKITRVVASRLMAQATRSLLQRICQELFFPVQLDLVRMIPSNSLAKSLIILVPIHTTFLDLPQWTC
jgi:hypothetical protein